MYFLRLNMMRNRIEAVDIVAYADSEQELANLLDRERVERYEDPMQEYGENKVYVKTFRKGGPLEWYNAPMNSDGKLLTPLGYPAIEKFGTREESMQRASDQWDDLRRKLPHAAHLL